MGLELIGEGLEDDGFEVHTLLVKLPPLADDPAQGPLEGLRARVRRGTRAWKRARGVVVVGLEGAQNTSSELEQALVWEYHSPVDFMGRITINPEVRAGKPCIRGTRITVYDLLEYLAGGMSEGDILEDFPSLEPEDIRAALEFAAARERRLASSAA